MSYLKNLGYEENSSTKHSLMLLELSIESVGMSGRAIKKIPFLAHALYQNNIKHCSIQKYFRSMHLAIQSQKENCIEN